MKHVIPIHLHHIISDHSILNFTLPISVVNEEADYYMQEGVFESVNYKYGKLRI